MCAQAYIKVSTNVPFKSRATYKNMRSLKKEGHGQLPFREYNYGKRHCIKKRRKCNTWTLNLLSEHPKKETSVS